MTVDYRRPRPAVEWFPVRNDSGEEIPAYAVMEVTDVITVPNGELAFAVQKPTKTHGLFLINDATKIEWNAQNRRTGRGTMGVNPIAAGYDTDRQTCWSTEWGPKPDQWTLHYGGFGFEILHRLSDGRVWVRSVPYGLVWGFLDADITEAGVRGCDPTTATVSVWKDVNGRWADTTVDITGTNRDETNSADEGSLVAVAWDRGSNEFRFVWEACNAVSSGSSGSCILSSSGSCSE